MAPRHFSLKMMRTCFIQVILVLFITACKQKGIEDRFPFSLKLSKNDTTRPGLAGTWLLHKAFGSETEPEKYDAELTIYENGIFKFHSKSIHGQTITEGTWSDKGLFITLRSSNDVQSSKKNITDTTYDPKQVFGDPNSIEHINFINKQFFQKRDSLISMDDTSIYIKGSTFN